MYQVSGSDITHGFKLCSCLTCTTCGCVRERRVTREHEAAAYRRAGSDQRGGRERARARRPRDPRERLQTRACVTDLEGASDPKTGISGFRHGPEREFAGKGWQGGSRSFLRRFPSEGSCFPHSSGKSVRNQGAPYMDSVRGSAMNCHEGFTLASAVTLASATACLGRRTSLGNGVPLTPRDL